MSAGVWGSAKHDGKFPQRSEGEEEMSYETKVPDIAACGPLMRPCGWGGGRGVGPGWCVMSCVTDRRGEEVTAEIKAEIKAE